jgi:hypothetical protein
MLNLHTNIDKTITHLHIVGKIKPHYITTLLLISVVKLWATGMLVDGDGIKVLQG